MSFISAAVTLATLKRAFAIAQSLPGHPGTAGSSPGASCWLAPSSRVRSDRAQQRLVVDVEVGATGSFPGAVVLLLRLPRLWLLSCAVCVAQRECLARHNHGRGTPAAAVRIVAALRPHCHTLLCVACRRRARELKLKEHVVALVGAPDAAAKAV